MALWYPSPFDLPILFSNCCSHCNLLVEYILKTRSNSTRGFRKLFCLISRPRWRKVNDSFTVVSHIIILIISWDIRKLSSLEHSSDFVVVMGFNCLYFMHFIGINGTDKWIANKHQLLLLLTADIYLWNFTFIANMRQRASQAKKWTTSPHTVNNYSRSSSIDLFNCSSIG